MLATTHFSSKQAAQNHHICTTSAHISLTISNHLCMAMNTIGSPLDPTNTALKR